MSPECCGHRTWYRHHAAMAPAPGWDARYGRDGCPPAEVRPLQRDPERGFIDVVSRQDADLLAHTDAAVFASMA